MKLSDRNPAKRSQVYANHDGEVFCLRFDNRTRPKVLLEAVGVWVEAGVIDRRTAKALLIDIRDCPGRWQVS